MDTAISPSGEDYLYILEDLLMKMTWVEYRRFWRELSDYNLTPAQFHTLVAIKENGMRCSMGHLADETNQVSATMTGIVDRLLERGWVERSRNPDDRRAVLVHLTAEGERVLEAVYRSRRSTLVDFLDMLDETARSNLVFSLKQYLQVLEAAS